MKCERCNTETEIELRSVWCKDSKRPCTFLCLICWGDLQIWLKRPPEALVDVLLEGQDGQVDHARPMGVEGVEP